MEKYIGIVAFIFLILGMVFKSFILIIVGIALIFYDFYKYRDILGKN